MNQETTESSQPPKYPEIKPSVMPISCADADPHQTDAQGQPAAIQEAGKVIAADPVGAHGEIQAGRGEGDGRSDLIGILVGQERGKDAGQDQDQQQRAAHLRAAVAEDLPEHAQAGGLRWLLRRGQF